MDRVVRITAYVCNFGLLVLAVLILANSHRSQELFFAVSAILPAILNIFALYLGPDLEERRLSRKLNKARMKADIEKLEGHKK